MSETLYADIRVESVWPEILWLHRQAKLGLADKLTPNEAAFIIRPPEVALFPNMKSYGVVILGYRKGVVL